jgi:hypothetical protein
MDSFTAFFSFTNGNISVTECKPVTIESISVVEGVKLAVLPVIYQNKLSGKITLQVKNDEMEVNFDITPEQHQPKVEQALSEMYSYRAKKH